MVGDRVVACIRPEHLTIGVENGGLTGTVELGLPLGAAVVHEIRLRNDTAVKVSEARDAGAAPRPPGTEITISPHPGAVFVFPEPAHSQ
jgi:putative spermidine/putrescine transport system ATP-binding protein